MKAFRVDEVTTYAAETAEEAQAQYIRDTGDEAHDLIAEFGPPQELVGAELETLVTEIDEPGQPQHTVRELLALMVTGKAGFLCSSEY